MTKDRDCEHCKHYKEETYKGMTFKDCEVWECKFEPEEKRIEYESSNGYRGLLYGKSSYAIFDTSGREVFHTGFRNIETYEELKERVDEFPAFLKMLEEHWEEMANDNEEDEI